MPTPPKKRRATDLAKYDQVLADLGKFGAKHGLYPEHWESYKADWENNYVRGLWSQKPIKQSFYYDPPANTFTLNQKIDGSNFVPQDFVASGSNYKITLAAIKTFTGDIIDFTEAIKDLEIKINDFGIAVQEIKLSSPVSLVNGDTLTISGTFTVPGDGPANQGNGKATPTK